MSHKELHFLHRLGRHLIWQHPRLYRPIGIHRRRGDCMAADYDVWIEGFPRSANTFARTAFQAANPGVKIGGRKHIPTFAIQAMRLGKPGMLLVRKPEDAALSWAIFWNEPVAGCLDYYIDFHRALRPCISDFFVVGFEEVTTRIDQVIKRFNTRFGTAYASIKPDSDAVSGWFASMEKMHFDWEGFVNERRVCRPSLERAGLKAEVSKQLQNPRIARKLDTANQLYAAIAPPCTARDARHFNATTQHLPVCS